MPLVGIEEINFQCVWILLNELTFNVFGPYLTTLAINIVVVAAAVTVVVAATAVWCCCCCCCYCHSEQSSLFAQSATS